MKQNQPTLEEQKALAAQLRKPEGDVGKNVGNFMNEGNRRMNLQTLAVLDARDKEQILEIGMGNGAFVPNILNTASGIKYIGVDFSPTMIHEAKRLNKQAVDTGQAAFIEANLEKLPIEDNSIDKAFTINTFYFWEHIDLCISELKRVIKPNGKFIISVRPKEILDEFPFCDYGFRKWTKSEILQELSQHALVNIEVTHVIEPKKEGFGKLMALETLLFECTV